MGLNNFTTTAGTAEFTDIDTDELSVTSSPTVTTGEATDTLHYGNDQDRDNAGDRGVALGIGSRVPRDDSVAVGFEAGKNNTGFAAVSVGRGAGQSNTGGNAVSVGFRAGRSNTGVNSVSVGVNAGRSNTGGSAVSVGREAGRSNTGDDAVGIGNNALRGDGLADPSLMGDRVVAIGKNAGRNNTGNGAILLGNVAGESNTRDDVMIVTDQSGNTAMELDLATGDLDIAGTVTENVTF
jgi:hypothetical protein